MGDYPYNHWVLKKNNEMEKLSFLEWLLDMYREKAEITHSWVDYLKAHALANSCLLRDPTEERARTVYDVETSWYGGNHPMRFEEHQALTNHQKGLLADYRKKTITNTEKLENLHKALDIDDIFSSDNLNLAMRFSMNVFGSSSECTDDFVDFSRGIILSSVQTLSSAGLEPPCSFAALGFGSIARGEATPFSDFEYGFLVESHEKDRYFTMLALQSYFQINNLGETPLKGFYMEELRVLDGYGVPLVKDLDAGFVEGYRIDGITERSGNIPTGNGIPGGKPLTRTPEGFFELYKTELLSPPGDKVGDLSHLLSSSVVVYASDGGNLLRERFMALQAEYETEAQVNESAIRKRLYQISSDIKNPNYKFIPEVLQHFSHFKNSNIKVKTDIFRYPTLLATNLRICLNLKSQTPWDTFSELVSLGLISEETCQFLHIVLAISIYIRTMAYLAIGTQAVMVSLYSKVKQVNSDRYHVPLNLFVILGYLLVPVKKMIRHVVDKHLSRVDGHSRVASIVTSLIRDISVDERDYMVKAEVLLYAGDAERAYDSLCQGMGENTVRNFDKFIICIRKKYETTKVSPLEKKYIEICGFALKSHGCYAEAINYLGWLALYETGDMNQVYWKLESAQCMLKIEKYKKATVVLNWCINTVKLQLGLSHESLESYILNTLNDQADISDYTLACFQTSHVLHQTLSHALKELGSLESSLENGLIAFRINDELLDWSVRNRRAGEVEDHQLGLSTNYTLLAAIYRACGQLEKSLDQIWKTLNLRKSIYGNSTNHIYIAESYQEVGTTYHSMGKHHLALEYHNRALTMRKAIYGDTTNHADIADSYNNIAVSYLAIENDQLALEYLTFALEMRKALYGDTTNHRDIASGYFNFGDTYLNMGKYQLALEYHTNALTMRKVVYGDTAIHPHIAQSYNNIGVIYHSMGKYQLALQYNTNALTMQKALYGDTTNHCDIAYKYHDIGDTYRSMGKYKLALEYHTKALTMRRVLYKDTANHTDIIQSYNNIGETLTQAKNYPAALEYLSAALVMFTRCRSENLYDLSEVLQNIAEARINLGEYKRALQFLNIRSFVTHDKYIEAKQYYLLSKCYWNLDKWPQCEDCLYNSLSLCRPLPSTERNRILLARVHLSIAVLLLHYGRVSQSLEHAQIALDTISDVISSSEAALSEHIEMKREAQFMTDSLQFIKFSLSWRILFIVISHILAFY